MNNLAKLAIAGGALLYFFWDQLFPGGTVTAAPGGPADTPPAQPAGPAQPPAGGASNTPPAVAVTIASKVAAAAGSGAKLNADVWNWHWTQASGVPQTADLFPEGDRGYLMSLEEYIQRRGTAGLSGLVLLGRVQ